MNPNHSRIIFSALILLLGYFAWGWSVHFLFCFTYLDWLTQEVATISKGEKIRKTMGGTPKRRYALISPALMLSSILLLETFFSMHHLERPLAEEWKAFLLLEDVGIPQGFILLPLLIFAVYMDYKLVFLKHKLYLRFTFSSHWEPHFQMQVARVMLVALLGIVAVFTSIPEIVMMIGLLLAPLIWEFVIKPRLKL